ncbi:hypothetical protein Gotri_022006 [Gossypium trilobum]|uniref:Uncharacterized protein n=1 Tax=Gossypium trilobum TaxID=34281 RepID=A0A7J9DEC4_9ROSI|nr:hypothetical protein [Gossypium trilobum]
MPLDFLQGDKFREAAVSYIQPLLTKGVPSLFSDLSPLYNHYGKADILEQLMLELEHSIRTTGRFPDRTEKESPSTLLWTLFFLAQHYDRRGQYDMALSKIDEAIQHTPTVIDLYSVKSWILKHAGDLVAAASLADEARWLWQKKLLHCSQKKGTSTTTFMTCSACGPVLLLNCLGHLVISDYYLDTPTECFSSFEAVEKHYADITEDQFDFHSYCLRKMTLRAYVEMLKFQDRLHSHSYFHKAAAGAIRCYLKLYDSPLNSPAEEEDHTLKTHQKKKMKKQRKAERAKKEADEKNEESSASGTSKSGKRHVKPVDSDPYGERLLKTEDPLSEATKYLKLLLKNSPDSLETHLFSFEAVKQLLRLDAEYPDSHRCLIKFFHKVGSMPAPATDSEKLVWSVLEAERPSISQFQEKTLSEANEIFLRKHQDSLMHRVVVAEMLYILDPTKKLEAVKLIEDSSNIVELMNAALGPIMAWKLKDCIAVHQLLEKVLVDQDAALRWKVRCAEYFPYSTYFEGSRSSAVNNLFNNQEGKTPVNGDTSDPEIGQSTIPIISNGKLEAF